MRANSTSYVYVVATLTGKTNDLAVPFQAYKNIRWKRTEVKGFSSIFFLRELIADEELPLWSLWFRNVGLHARARNRYGSMV